MKETLRQDPMAPWPAAALIDALALDRPSPGPGDPLPPFWHWLYFPESVPVGQTGRDGHPAPGVLLPETGLPRRMWAGGALDFLAPLPLGAPATRRSMAETPVQKTGRSGPLAFVTAHHEIAGPAGVAVRERQDLVYREDPAPGGPPTPPREAPTAETARQAWRLGSADLFRYSALTYNAHRIHYDRDYARGVEGYPDIVVHGPLLATLMLELATTALPARFAAGFIGHFSFRAVSPVFADERFETCLAAEGDGARLWVRAADGRLAMEGTVA
ncbi:MAG: acyl dehydratase [Pseudomonadota bacterium]